MLLKTRLNHSISRQRQIAPTNANVLCQCNARHSYVYANYRGLTHTVRIYDADPRGGGARRQREPEPQVQLDRDRVSGAYYRRRRRHRGESGPVGGNPLPGGGGLGRLHGALPYLRGGRRRVRETYSPPLYSMCCKLQSIDICEEGEGGCVRPKIIGNH